MTATLKSNKNFKKRKNFPRMEISKCGLDKNRFFLENRFWKILSFSVSVFSKIFEAGFGKEPVCAHRTEKQDRDPSQSK